MAVKHGLSPEDAALLKGSEDEMEALAARLAGVNAVALETTAATTTTTARRPVTALRPGATPGLAPLAGDGLEAALRAAVGG
jgi:hypothetical protein